MRPTVVAIHVAPGRRLPTHTVTHVEAEAGAGLVGDRYHGSRHRHVTLQSAVDLEQAAADLGRPVDPGLTRRNLTISGGTIPTRPGARITWVTSSWRSSASPPRAGCSTTRSGQAPPGRCTPGWAPSSGC